MKYHLFRNWQYVRSVDAYETGSFRPMLAVIADFQRQEANLNRDTFTIINDEFGFSQEYERHRDGKVSWGNMYKHMKGIPNPSVPSYDDLMRAVPSGMFSELVGIYVNSTGWNILSFDPAKGDIMEQAYEYAERTFNDPEDKPKFVRMSPVAVQSIREVKSKPITPSYDEMDLCPLCRMIHSGKCKK